MDYIRSKERESFLQKKWWHRLSMVFIWTLVILSVPISIFNFLNAINSEEHFVFSYQESFHSTVGTAYQVTIEHKNVGAALIADILRNGSKYNEQHVRCMNSAAWKYNTADSGWINFGRPLTEIINKCYLGERLEFKRIYATPQSAYSVLMLPIAILTLLYVLYYKIVLYIVLGSAKHRSNVHT